MRRLLGLSSLIAICGLAAPATTSAQFTIDDFPPSVVPGRSQGTIPGWSGHGYGGYGPKGYGYWTGLALPPDDIGHGPSGAFSPIFSSLIATPKASQRDLKRYDLDGAPHAGPPPGTTAHVAAAPPPAHHVAPPHAHRSLKNKLFFWRR